MKEDPDSRQFRTMKAAYILYTLFALFVFSRRLGQHRNFTGVVERTLYSVLSLFDSPIEYIQRGSHRIHVEIILIRYMHCMCIDRLTVQCEIE